MPLSAFKRPLFLLTAAYAAALFVLKSCGLFRVEAPLPWRYFAWQKESLVEGTVRSGFSAKRAGDRYWLRLDTADGRAQPPVDVMAYINRRDSAVRRLRPGMRAAFRGRLRLPMWPRNPGDFDERSFLEQRGAALVMHAREVDILAAAVAPRFRLWAAGESVHRSMHAYFARRFPAASASIIEGILIGFKGRLPPALARAIQDAGVMHLLTPSGAKVTAVLAVAFLLVSALGQPPGVRAAAALLAGGAYLLVVGPEPPYTRAYGMAAAAALGAAFGRGRDVFACWTLAAGVTLLVDPRALFSAGFQLTYLAMLGLIIALPRWRPPLSWPSWARGLAAVFSICFIVQLMLWPTFAHFFNRGSLAGFFVNAAVVPASPLLMAAAALSWAGDALGVALVEAPAAAVAEALACGFAALCLRVSRLPYAAVDLAPAGINGLAAYYCAVLGVLTLPRRRTCLRLWLCGGALWLGAAGVRVLAPQPLRVLVFAPPAARGLLVEYPDGRRVLVDGGIRPSALRSLRRSLGLRDGSVARAASGGLELSHGQVAIIWDGSDTYVSTGGKVEYCIMASPSVLRRCPNDQAFVLRRHGAVRITSNGQSVKIETQKEYYSFGHPVS